VHAAYGLRFLPFKAVTLTPGSSLYVQAPKRGPKGREPAPAPAAASSGKAKKVRIGEKDSGRREAQGSGRRQRMRARGLQA